MGFATSYKGTPMQSIDTLLPKHRQLSVRLAVSRVDIEAAQRLRWDVFYGDMGARSVGFGALDIDHYDAVCEHLLVEDSADGTAKVVGTYRLLRQRVAAACEGFYSAGEYDLTLFAGRDGEILELGRSCVAPDYRDAGTIQLLWRGIAAYLVEHGVSMMFGCASFHGVDPEEHAETLSYLWHNHLAPLDLRARALDDRYVDMARLPLGGYDPRQAIRKLPPLIKAYLRIGAMIGDGAVIDHQFNTVDVFIVMPVTAISERYLYRFGAAA
jgi:L-ornithine Nalpha-acyltransferase